MSNFEHMNALEPVSAALFDMRTGDYIRRIPVGVGTSWAKAINAPGSYSLKLPNSPVSRLSELHEIAKPWKTCVAILRGKRVLHAGPVLRRPWAGGLKLDGAGYWQYLMKRLVLPHALEGRQIDGEVLIDEENPGAEWILALSGQTYVDIATKLLEETAKWQDMPVDLPIARSGPYFRTYYGYDLATVAERLKQLTELQFGPELRFDAYLRPDGGLRWKFDGDQELVNRVWQWNTSVPDQGVKITALDDDGTDIVTDVWAQGGRNDDLLLMARQQAADPQGLPLLQGALTSHSTVSELETLRGHAAGEVRRTMNTYGQVQLEAPLRYEVEPGDWIELRTERPYLGRTQLALKVVGVSGNDGERQKIDTRVRYDD